MSGHRGHHEGTIGKLKDGRWQARLTLSGGKRKAVYGKTRREVTEKLTDLQLSVRQGQDVAEAGQRVHRYLTRWLESVKPTVRPRTYESYVLNVNRALPSLGHFRLDALKPAHLQDLYIHLQTERRLSALSVQQLHSTLRIAFRQGVRLELLQRSPTEAVKPPRATPKEMHPLTENEIRTLFSSTVDERLHALWVLFLTTGLRIGEALGLKWTDIDFDRGSLLVQRQLQRQVGEGLVFVPPKTAKSRRTIRLASGTLEVLRHHRERQRTESRRAANLWEDSNLVFCTEIGLPLDPGTVNHMLENQARRAGLPKITPHGLRHTVASYLAGLGAHPSIVQGLLGHSSSNLTLNTYTHILPSLHDMVATQMDGLFDDEAQTRPEHTTQGI